MPDKPSVQFIPVHRFEVDSMRTDDDSELTVEFYTRPLTAAPERRQSICEWLERADATGTIDGYSLDTWPDEVEFGSGDEALELFAAFEAWGEQVGADVRPPFQVRTHRSLLAAQEQEVLVTPELCLAAYEDDELVAVRPCQRDGVIETVEEYLSSLEQPRHTATSTRPPEVQTQ